MRATRHCPPTVDTTALQRGALSLTGDAALADSRPAGRRKARREGGGIPCQAGRFAALRGFGAAFGAFFAVAGFGVVSSSGLDGACATQAR